MRDDVRVMLRPSFTCPIGVDRMLIRCEAGAVVLPRQVGELIAQMSSLRRISEHCQPALAASDLSASQHQLLRQRIGEMAQRGFFLTEEQILSRIGPVTSGGTSITTLAMVANGLRSTTLDSLQSYVANAALHRGESTVMVSDDSTGPEGGEALRDALVSLRNMRGITSRYLGRAEKKEFARRLSGEADVPVAVVEDTMGLGEPQTFTRGGNTNALLLDTVDEALFCWDDDTFCHPGQMSGATTRARFASNGQPPLRLAPAPSQEALLSQVELSNACLFEGHEAWLGRSLSELVRSGELDAGQLDPLGVTALMTGRGRICVTWAGTYGDSGSESASYLLFLEGEERERLMADEHQYGEMMQNRQVWKAPLAPTVARPTFFQSMAFAVDNRAFLPPFLPWGRGSDNVFGGLCLQSMDNAYFAFLPLSIRHAPQPPRREPRDSFVRLAGERSLQALVGLCLREIGPGQAGNGAEALGVMGDLLMNVATLSLREMSAFCLPSYASAVSAQIGVLERLLDRYGGRPAFWAKDVRQLIQCLEGDLLREGPFLGSQKRSRGGADGGGSDGSGCDGEWPSIAARLARFGAVLKAWPTMRAAASRLRSRGIRASRSVS
jgi:hypothetical protein